MKDNNVLTANRSPLDLESLILKHGGHASPDDGMCVKTPRRPITAWNSAFAAAVTACLPSVTGSMAYARSFDAMGINDLVVKRFFRHVLVVGECWTWTAKKDHGYGRFHEGGKQHQAHRWLWERVNGAVPAGLVLDHLCRNRACCNPSHLEPVTNAANLDRSTIASATINKAKTHCPGGHPYDDANTLVRNNGQRECRECGRSETRAYLAKNRDARNERRRLARQARKAVVSA